MHTHQREQLLLGILDLTMACPHDNSNPPFCPLHEVRKLTPKERIAWVRALTDEDLEYLTAYHQICLAWRSTMA